MKNCLPFITLLLLSFAAIALDITIEGVEWMRNAASKTYSARFTVSWNNSWRHDRGARSLAYGSRFVRAAASK